MENWHMPNLSGVKWDYFYPTSTYLSSNMPQTIHLSNVDYTRLDCMKSVCVCFGSVGPCRGLNICSRWLAAFHVYGVHHDKCVDWDLIACHQICVTWAGQALQWCSSACLLGFLEVWSMMGFQRVRVVQEGRVCLLHRWGTSLLFCLPIKDEIPIHLWPTRNNKTAHRYSSWVLLSPHFHRQLKARGK